MLDECAVRAVPPRRPKIHDGRLLLNHLLYFLAILCVFVCDHTEFLIESASGNECEVHEPEDVDTHGVGLEG